jgi:hypothetical protein
MKNSNACPKQITVVPLLKDHAFCNENLAWWEGVTPVVGDNFVISQSIQGLEPMINHTWGKHANHYTIDGILFVWWQKEIWVKKILFIYVFLESHFAGKMIKKNGSLLLMIDFDLRIIHCFLLF